MSETTEYDVLVVGCGVAGLSAAVAAQQTGAKVCILERAPKHERGGNSRYTGAYLRMKSKYEVSSDFEEHFAENAGGYLDPSLIADVGRPKKDWTPALKALSFVDPNVISKLAEEAPATLDWLEGFGLRFIPLDVPFPTSVQPRMVPSGGGLAIIETLGALFENNGGTIIYETAAQSLVQNASGGVCGLRCTGPGNAPVEMWASAVVLASGGFQGNAEMMNRYIGPRARFLRAMSVGCHYNKGEGIRMALDIGAAPCGDFGSFHSSPMDPRSNRPGPSLHMYNYGILVNKSGERFVDEGPGPNDETYESVTREIFDQKDGLSWAIFDCKLDDLPNRTVAIRTEQPAIEADSLQELAKKLGLAPDILIRTVNEYNQACPKGRKWDPLRVDGLSTAGLVPQKSNWAMPLDQAPYRAYPIISSIVFTFGGLKTDVAARVLNHQGETIPGLYAAGEVMGIYYGNYTGATSVLKGLVFGRIAGKDAAAHARH